MRNAEGRLLLRSERNEAAADQLIGRGSASDDCYSDLVKESYCDLRELSNETAADQLVDDRTRQRELRMLQRRSEGRLLMRTERAD